MNNKFLLLFIRLLVVVCGAVCIASVIALWNTTPLFISWFRISSWSLAIVAIGFDLIRNIVS